VIFTADKSSATSV